MKSLRLNRAQAFALVVGLADGILTSLTLAASHLFHANRPTVDLALRVAIGSSISGIFVFFTAEYARLRSELVHAEKELNLLSHGFFATAQLGKQVRSEALVAAALSSTSNFLGAFLPLLFGIFMPGPSFFALFPPLVALGCLGAALARTIHGRYLFWILSLIAVGLVLSYAGVLLHIA